MTTRTARPPSAAYAAREAMAAALADLDARGVPEASRLRCQWAWCTVLATEEERVVACVRLLEDQQREIRRLTAELDALRVRLAAGRE